MRMNINTGKVKKIYAVVTALLLVVSLNVMQAAAIYEPAIKPVKADGVVVVE